MNRRRIWTYVIGIGIPLSVGAVSGLLTMGAMESFQESVNQSALTPPGIVFPIVWTVLYTLMGISSARIYLAMPSEERTKGLTVYVFQLIFNFFWSLFFFNMRAFGFSLLWILALWALIGLMIISFRKVDPLAALLQIPYFLWVTFAAYLNYTVWRLNP